jgi:hypothetical protein
LFREYLQSPFESPSVGPARAVAVSGRLGLAGRVVVRADLPILDTNVIKTFQGVPLPVILLIATVLEAGGDAIVRMAIYKQVGLIRAGLFLAGGALLLG